MKRKLRQNKGETLIEALVSLLIAVLAIGFVSTTWIAATNMNKRNRENDAKYRLEMERADGVRENGVDGKLIIEFHNSDWNTEADILIYGGDGSFVTYEGGDES